MQKTIVVTSYLTVATYVGMSNFLIISDIGSIALLLDLSVLVARMIGC